MTRPEIFKNAIGGAVIAATLVGLVALCFLGGL